MKTIPLILLILLASCRSFLLTGSESFSEMYVQRGPGFVYQPVKVTTFKISRISVRTLAFYLEIDGHKIWIPRMDMNDQNTYVGTSDDGTLYNVNYFFDRKSTVIQVQSKSNSILVSTDTTSCHLKTLSYYYDNEGKLYIK